jgi:hypothetical protein
MIKHFADSAFLRTGALPAADGDGLSNLIKQRRAHAAASGVMRRIRRMRRAA